MGNCNNREDDPEEMARQRAIEKMLREDRKVFVNEVKLLLLGAGGSGKSTLAKQMKILYLNGFTEQEKMAFRDIIASNIYTNVKALITFCLNHEFHLLPSTLKIMEKAWINDPSEPLTKPIMEDIKVLWSDPSLRKAFDTNEGQIEDSTPYFMKDENLDRFCEDDYCPSIQDVLRARVKTTGVNEIFFNLARVKFRMVDVGGQRSERRKWIHCFEDVSAVIFFVAMSEYNQYLLEDPEVKRMHESIALFDEVVNARWFAKSAIILFMNKCDLFKEKIKTIDMKCMFDDYKGGNDYDKGCKFLTNIYVNLIEQDGNQPRDVYPHVTCATDTENVKFVFDSVQSSILGSTMDNLGMTV